MLSLKMVDLFIFYKSVSYQQIELLWKNKKILTFDEPFQIVFHEFFFKGQLRDHTIKLPNEGMSEFTLMFKFLDLTKLMQCILTAIFSSLMLSFLCGIQNRMNFPPVF